MVPAYPNKSSLLPVPLFLSLSLSLSLYIRSPGPRVDVSTKYHYLLSRQLVIRLFYHVSLTLALRLLESLLGLSNVIWIRIVGPGKFASPHGNQPKWEGISLSPPCRWRATIDCQIIPPKLFGLILFVCLFILLCIVFHLVSICSPPPPLFFSGN
ncbi:hypothetical protein BO78DRAFT_67335 [Aspergillus sclerotiicarbonarius CBS 121057]|uniref:Uncharacterized protein n=1 Tax=Aspergillus sclerotiicarbonarius (strain CBS 121057 / IBT 28362) TaxID=1448318 RepID=A0A319EVX1_ASPSB|nr:hypothetical protein BO78DRAFT_67335 [Aspergillus sclerotiicarbonarius CBS 121057]